MELKPGITVISFKGGKPRLHRKKRIRKKITKKMEHPMAMILQALRDKTGMNF